MGLQLKCPSPQSVSPHGQSYRPTHCIHLRKMKVSTKHPIPEEQNPPWNNTASTSRLAGYLLIEFSSISKICAICSLSALSSVRVSTSFRMSGTFMICCTGATNKSVSCSFLQRRSLLHHFRTHHKMRRKHNSITCIYFWTLVIADKTVFGWELRQMFS